MKTKTWIAVIAGVFVLAVVLSAAVLLPGKPAARAEVWSEGELLEILDLTQDRELTVKTAGGSNTLTVRDGTLAVTAADCPDGLCMRRGWCSSGQTVCLPNRLVIRFAGERTVDGVSG